MNKRVALFAFIFLVSISLAVAQYCPSPRAISGSHSREVHLNDKEGQVWSKYNNNVDSLKRLQSDQGMAGMRARDDLKTLQHILDLVDNANERNKADIAREMLEKQCKETSAINAQGTCIGQVILNPDWQEKASFMPGGVYLPALIVSTSGTGQCSYYSKNAVPTPGKQLPKKVVQEEQGPPFDCNNVPPTAFFSRTYTSMYKGHSVLFHVYSYQNWEMHCANTGGNYWELARKFSYDEQAASVMPASATGGVSVLGKIQTLKTLPEGRLAGIIARIDGRSPSRLTYLVRDVQLRQGQTVRFVPTATGLVTALTPVR